MLLWVEFFDRLTGLSCLCACLVVIHAFQPSRRLFLAGRFHPALAANCFGASNLLIILEEFIGTGMST